MSGTAVLRHAPAHRVTVCLDNVLLCRSIEALLRAQPTVATVRRCATRREAVGLLDAGEIDILIAAASDVDWLGEITGRARGQGVKILAIMDLAEPGDVARYPTGTVDGYLSPQNLSAASLRDALARCANGEVPMPGAVARALLATVDSYARRAAGPVVRLTARESETLILLVDGLTNKEIARRLAISSHGAKRLVASIMLKLNAPNRTAAVVNAIKAGLVDYQ